jgi:hypothetical protein
MKIGSELRAWLEHRNINAAVTRTLLNGCNKSGTPWCVYRYMGRGYLFRGSSMQCLFTGLMVAYALSLLKCMWSVKVIRTNHSHIGYSRSMIPRQWIHPERMLDGLIVDTWVGIHNKICPNTDVLHHHENSHKNTWHPWRWSHATLVKK